VTLRIVIEKPAKADLASAIRWYKRIQPGLHSDFRLCVRAALNRIARHPEAYPVVGRRFRKALLERFPFAVFYLSEGDAIHVFGVMHTRRSPLLWQARDH
jgi:plasmid stabilization system protein ParE